MLFQTCMTFFYVPQKKVSILKTVGNNADLITKQAKKYWDISQIIFFYCMFTVRLCYAVVA